MGKRKQGFACLSPEQRTAIARLGGKQCQLLGLGNQFNSETGKLAGHKGGTASSRKPGHMSRLGKLGAESRRLAKLRGQRGLGEACVYGSRPQL
jgi:general stress protein YciG